jgi:GT2 family glycosyltransferase
MSQNASDTAASKNTKSAATSHPGQTAVLVLGMHRSGTSALTRLINLLGADLGRDLMKAAADNNETGFWEHQGLVDAHEALMETLGLRWSDPRPMPEGWLDSDAAKTARAKIEAILDDEFADASLWCVKDPRMCRLLPLWRPILEARGVRIVTVNMVRNPLEIARSLERRDKMPRGMGLLLWLRHQAEAIEHGAGLEQIWLGYDGLLSDWRAELAPLAEALGVAEHLKDPALAETVDGFLKPNLRHHALDAMTLTEDETLAPWVGRLFSATQSREPGLTESVDPQVKALAGDIRADLDRFLVYVGDSLEWASTIEIGLRKLIAERDAWVGERDRSIIERDRSIADRDGKIAAMDADLRREVASNRFMLKSLKEEREETQKLLDSTSWRITAPLRAVATRIKAGPRAAGKFWWIKPITWLYFPIWFVMFFLKLPNRMRTHLRWKVHKMTLRPQSGVTYNEDGTFGTDGSVARFELKSNLGFDPLYPVFMRVVSDIESEDGLVHAWLVDKTSSGIDYNLAIPLPLRAGKGSYETVASGPTNGLWVQAPGADVSPRLKVNELTVIEIGGVLMLLHKLMRYAKQHGLSWRAWLHLYRKLMSSGPSEAANNALYDVATVIKNPVYHAWIHDYDQLRDADIEAINARIADMPTRPKLSVVMPTYNPPIKWLKRAIESVEEQLYPDWEFCIADDCSPNPEVAEVLREAAARDPRIKIVLRETNGHISKATNSALELVEGAFIVLLDHDDELPKHALYMVAEEINAHPDADVIYSDEDKIDENGVRSAPYFKCQYNPDLLMGQNMISHLGVYRTSLIREIGGFRSDFDGSQDYDLALRAIEQTTPDKVRHIPHILYHWRAIQGSVALSGDQKGYAHIKAREAIKSHLDRVGDTHAQVTPTYNHNLHRVTYPLPDPAPKVSVIIPTKNATELLKVAVESCLERTDYPNLEILIIDNQSDDPAAVEYLRAISSTPNVQVIPYDKPFNFADMNNVAASHATGEVLCFLNNDTEVIDRDWLAHMVSHAMRRDIGAVGAKLLFTQGSIQHAGIVLVPELIAWHAFAHFPRENSGYFGRGVLQQNFSAVTAACLVVRKELFDLVGGYDAEAFAVSYNDVDFCLRLNAKGYRTLWTPFATLYHHQSATLGKPMNVDRSERFAAEAATFRARWGEVLDDDPCFSPNLNSMSEEFGLAFPPRVFKPWKHGRATASGRALPSGLNEADGDAISKAMDPDGSYRKAVKKKQKAQEKEERAKAS